MGKKIGIVSLGCAKNQVDSEMMLAKAVKSGYELTQDASQADAIIVNTCAFIDEAKNEAIENILEMAQFKKDGKCKRLIVTGCLPERFRDEIEQEFPEVDAVLGTGSYLKIAEALDAVFEGAHYADFSDKGKAPISASRVLTTPFYTAYLKIAEGCDNHCAYCTIPSIRGSYRSRPVEEILKEAENLVKTGVKELILIAQDTTRYGIDLYGEYKLTSLLQALEKLEGVKWIRLHYLYPDLISDELIEQIANSEKILPYFDIPIQHASDKMLSSMNRRGDRAYLLSLFGKIQKRIPDASLRTTVIAGFPGETKEDLEALLSFMRKVEFDKLGAFAYSREEGTVGYGLPDQVEEKVKNKRVEILLSEQGKISLKKNRMKRGKTLEVLTEGYDMLAGCYFGRSKYDSLDVDGKVFFKAPKGSVSEGAFVPVKITGFEDYDLYGEIKQ